MKVLLAVHGYPPELVGGTELAVRRLAHALVRAGHETIVFAGTLDWEKRGTLEETRDPVDDAASSGGAVRVLRYSRDDLYFDHWAKGRSARVRAAFIDVLRAERPDVVHVHHWIRLSRDLVAAAATCGVPSVVSLHDAWTSCLVAFRIRPATREACNVPLAAEPCVACAAHLPPPTPWLAADEARARFAAHRSDLVRELRLARAIVVPTHSHTRTIEAGLLLAPGALAAHVVPPPIELPTPVRTPPRFTRGDVLRVGSWGHYSEHKGLDLLIDAVRACDGRVELRLAGGVVLPEYRAQLEERARGLPVVFDDGFAPHELATHRVSDVHLFASGSRARESWGLVVDEAFALGLPVVLPNAGAFEERVGRHAAARLYEQGSSAALAAVLRELAKDPTRVASLTAAVPKRAELVRSGDDHARALLPLYAEAQRAGAHATNIAFDDARDLAEQASFDARVAGTG